MRGWRWPALGVAIASGALALSTRAGRPAAASTAASALPTAIASNPWASETMSPRPGIPNDATDAPIANVCGGGVDGGLMTVATELAQSLAIHGELPDAQEIEWRQRKAGNPHVWPRTWGAHVDGGVSLDRKALAKDVLAWLGASASRVRCGVASYRIGSGSTAREAIALIAIDPMADLASLPTKAKIGAWIDLDAELLRAGTNGRVILLPPSGAPKTILSSTSADVPAHVKARFLLGGIGRYVVQVLADDGSGPRPVLEAEVYAGIDPPMAPPSSEVPGEAAGDSITDPADALYAQLNGARKAESLSKLSRDATLDAVAKAHAQAMLDAHLLGHDVGDGDPASRVAATGVKWKVIGENVAKAKSERTAHRALYASPSHRSNMLDSRFTNVGIAVVMDPKTGELWVAQTYGG